MSPVGSTTGSTTGSTAGRRVPAWSTTAIARLEDALECPVCAQALTGQRCGHCGADFTGDIGGELWNASTDAVAALRARQDVLDRVPIRPFEAPAAPVAAPVAAPRPDDLAPPRSSATVQSVLAVAGAGLVAVAAIVFTFFNPDLTDSLIRGLIVGGVTIVFLVGARVLARRGLQFSAEAVGALGLVFLGLDIHALTALSPQHPWTVASVATFVAGTAMTALGLRIGIRVWLWTSLVALSVVPAMIGYATDAPVLGYLGTALAAFALLASMDRLASRFGAPLRGERVSLTVVQLIAIVVAPAQGYLFGEFPPDALWLSLAGVLAGSAALALFSTRHPASRLWSFLAGAFGTAAFAVATLAVPLESGVWFTALIPATAVAGAIVVGALLPVPRTVSRPLLAGGALTVVAVTALTPTAWALMLGATTVLLRSDSGGADLAVAVVIGLTALAGGLGLFAWLSERRHPSAESVELGVDKADAGETPIEEETLGAIAVPGAASAATTGLASPASAATTGLASPASDATSAVSASAASVALDAASAAVDAAVPPVAAPIGIRWIGYLGLWYAGLAALTLLTVPTIALWGRISIGLVLAAAVSIALARVPALRGAPVEARVPLLVGAHLLVLLAGILSWREVGLAAASGAPIVAAVALLALAMPAAARFVYVGVGYAYALVVFATALSLQGVEGVALLCLTTSAGAIVAIAATFLPGVRVRSWYAVLAVTTVPFLMGVAQVVFERSGWTALSTGLIFLLALTLVVTRRPGLGTPLRLMAAGLLVPSLAVVVVCLGAQVLAGSGSPVVLPVIALIVALVLPCAQLVQTPPRFRIAHFTPSGPAPQQSALLESAAPRTDAALVRLAIEASALLTAAIAVLLALVRDAAGLPTTFLVLVILGVGGAATSLWGGRRYGWALAAAAFTGALWCVWGIAGVDVLEPYLLPPALGAAVVGAIVAFRGGRGLPLYAAGLVAAVVPLVVLAAVSGPPLRAYALVAASWLLLVVAGLFGRASANRAGARIPVAHGAAIDPVSDSGAGLRMLRPTWLGALRDPVSEAGAGLRMLRPVTFAMAIVAAAAGAAQGVRFGLGLDAVAVDLPLVLVCIGTGLLGAVPAALAARALRRGAAEGSRLARTRWLYAPAFAYVAVAAWPSIERDWFTIWTMWALMLAFLVALVAVAWRGLRRETGLPPVWFVFGLAFATAVVAWSPRDLRVEWFSLPLGAALLLAGVLAMRIGSADAASTDAGESASVPRPSLTSWPAGWSGSWALLAPGIIVTMSASIAATFTDPLTWRAILVIVLALVAILVGASRRLAAPFLIGIVVLPVENAIAFLVQIGRGIESMPWWITLAVVGAVLLIIAVTYERRAGEESGIAARLRDLS